MGVTEALFAALGGKPLLPPVDLDAMAAGLGNVEPALAIPRLAETGRVPAVGSELLDPAVTPADHVHVARCINGPRRSGFCQDRS